MDLILFSLSVHSVFDRESEVFFGKGGGRLGGVYHKAVYVAYTDDTFSTKKSPTDGDQHLGILGTPPFPWPSSSSSLLTS